MSSKTCVPDDADGRPSATELRLRAVIETAVEGIVSFDERGRIETFNRAAEQIFGRASADVLGSDVASLIPALADSADPGDRKLGGAVIRVVGLQEDGAAIPLELSLSEALVGDERLSTAIVRDLRGRTLAEELGEILESSLNEIFLFHADTLRFVHVNRGARDNLQYSMEELRMLTPLDLKPDLTHEAFGDRLEPLRSGDKAKIEFTAVHRRKDGSEYPVEVHLQLAGFKSEPVFLAVILDTTERSRLETRLIQAQKLESIGQLAAGVAHEINTPMQFVGDNLSFLEGSFQDLVKLEKDYALLVGAARRGAVSHDLLTQVEHSMVEADRDFLLEEIPSALSQAQDGARRVEKIVRAMKDFSHPGDDEKREPANLNDAIESTLTIAAAEWKHVAEVVKNLAEDLPAVPCFRQELNQAFLNLIVNASHAIADAGGGDEEKGTITVSTRSLEESVEIRVADTGTGIPEAVRGKVFDPFFTTKSVGRGTGQGLAIAYNSIVARHGGDLSFETETGRGTTFIIRIPLEDPSRVDADTKAQR